MYLTRLRNAILAATLVLWQGLIAQEQGAIEQEIQLLNNIFKELDKRVGRKYAVSIFDGNEEIYSHYLNNRLNEKKWVKETTINFNGLTWRMQLCPEPELLAQERYFLEELLLIGGLVMAFLLSLAIALVQSRQRRLKIIDAANQQLTHEIAERQRVEEVLRESQSQLQDFFDNANDLIQSVSLDDGHLIYVNHAWHKTLGYPPEDQQRLFESFHRATNVGQIEGTGLGLAIVKKSVDLHDGKIAMNSEVGAGTTFTVKLPLNRDRPDNCR